MNKFEAAAEVFEKYDYNIDDVAKLLCRLFGNGVKSTGATKSQIRKVIYGQGSKFILRINMLPQESHEATNG